MHLVVGLGNPGPRYARTRHNIGFLCVEEVARRLGLAFRDQPSYRVARGDGPDGPLTLLEPLTYMNRSGQALEAWARDATMRIGPALQDADGLVTDPALLPLVICDDLHLPLGSIRIRAGGSDGGQNGLASIIDTVETRDVPRVRLGVGPLVGEVDPAHWADYVLEPFPDADEPAVADLVANAADAVLAVLHLGPAGAASRHNRRVRPAPDLPAEG